MELYAAGSYCLPDAVPAQQPGATAPTPNRTAEALQRMVAERRATVQASVDATLAAFDMALAADAVKLEQEPDALERIAVKWLPPVGWHFAAHAATKALAEKTRMAVSWNGCPQCPVWLKPYTPLPARQAFDASKAQGALRALGAALRGGAATADDAAALTEALGPAFDALRDARGATPATQAYSFCEGEGFPFEACTHQHHTHAVRHRPPRLF